MSFYEQLSLTDPADRQKLQASGDTHRDITESITRQHELRLTAREEAQKAAKAILHQLCENDTIPMAHRAAWSAAFASQKGTAYDLAQFAERAEQYNVRLAEIDAPLREPGAPIVGFITGPAGDYRDNPQSMRYAYRESAGSGLTFTQHYNRGQKWHYHGVQADERKLPSRPNILSNRQEDPLIYGTGPHDLIENVHSPQNAANLLQYGSIEPTTVFVIGSQAVNELFATVRSNPCTDLLLGHAVKLGFRPDF